uniref:C2H2-type domain-containing protein n=1 Tax=Anopheles triannulatus TaxID=58253 RepID=A0A2M4A8X1_9DIPT
MDVAPSMVQRSGDKLIVRRVVSGERVHLGEQDDSIAPIHQQVLLEPGWRQTLENTFGVGTGGSSSSPQPPERPSADDPIPIGEMDQQPTPQQQQQQDEQHLPQCKIKRNYSCGRCTYFTQNPRKYLTHLRDTHGEKIVINECKRCLYASRHYQKLVRHMKMVHGSVDGIKKSGQTSFSSTSSSSSSFGHGGRRNRIQRTTGYLGANEVLHHHNLGGNSGSGRFLMRSNDADRELATAYVQQLVAASGLPKLLEEMERSVASTSIGASKGFQRTGGSSEAEELPRLNQIMPYSSETIQEARRRTSTDDDHDDDDGDDEDDGDEVDGRLLDNAVSTEEGEADTKPKKRPRPIPNLIPLSASSSPATTSGATKGMESPSRRFVKPLPLSALTAESVEEPAGTQIVPTRCVYCELSFKTVESLANHIKLAHKEDLIAALLQSSFEETEPSTARSDGNTTPATTTTAASAVNMWQRLLDCSAEVRRAELERSSNTTSSSSSSNNRDVKRGNYRMAGPLVEEALDDDSGREGDEHQHLQQHHQQSPHTQQTYCGIETAPGYGEVISRVPVDPGTSNTLMKKVFKCPHCSFWASTASRFHVHIVGHLNKKPFECSLCAYRSNWRWDITKHIRLKTIRDPSHKNAGVLMNDETGRRNYTKYNKYMALMQITDK